MRLHISVSALAGLVACSDYSFHGKQGSNQDPVDDTVPAITVSPDPVDFGIVYEAGTVDKLVTIENPGDAELQIAAVRIDGPSVFTVTIPEAEVVPPGGQTTLTVSFSAGSSTSDHTGRLEVSSNASNRPTASVDLQAAVEMLDTGEGEPGPDESTECTCPDGFEPIEGDDETCFRETETPATPTGEVVEVCAISPYFAYGNYGAKYPGGGVQQDTYWGQNDGVANGRLNSTGVWGCSSPGSTTAGSQPVGSWVGFSVCVDVVSDGDYLLGLGGDNRVRFSVDGALVMAQSDDHTRNFNYWHMHALSLTAGTHIIDVEGYNAGSIAAFGAELAGPFAADSLVDDDAMIAADYAGHIVWATSDAIGNAFPLGDTVGWECPDGTELEGCEEPTCLEREEVPCVDIAVP